MKTILSIFLSVICITQVFSNKLDDVSPVTKTNPYKGMVHFSPLSLTVGGMELGYEKAMTKKESILFHVGYYLSEPAGSLDAKGDYSNLNGVRIDLQYRFYRKPNNYIQNVYIAPFLNLRTLSADFHSKTYTYNPAYTITETTENQSASVVSFGYMLGLRKSLLENIYLDWSIGGGLFLPVQGDNHKELHIGFFNPYQKGVQFKANFGIVIAL